MTTMITAMMNNRATITPMTGPIALLLLPLSAADCCGELTMYTVNIHITCNKIKLSYDSSS